MQIVTDRGCDIAPEQMDGLDIHYAPMKLTLDGETYSSGVDVQPEEFYELLSRTEGFPTTSQPSAGDFAALYRELARTDADILSVHISSGLSGTLDSARAGAAMVPEARVIFWDTKTLSCPEAWQVLAAARAVRDGLSLERIYAMLEQLRKDTIALFTLDTLKYLIHGGRISHLKGLLASVLHIRPVIGVEPVQGKYITMGQERTMKRALHKMAEVVAAVYPEGSAMRFQLMHGKNLEAVAQLREILEGFFSCEWLPVMAVAPILGAHTGGSVVGLCAGPVEKK
jgi:DegV family protein with EDD domain